ncbi:uncharacterized protein LOC143288862 [Babylonia areolata]|uniref:uncharacterized protein LOC143288862 n=1 Tax=Babylonia areolata TaxID=304850 RepID=UPI003FD309CF
MREMHQKLSEMQKVAVQKVQQTQQQVDSLHELNQAQSNKINELNSLIQQEKDSSLKTVEDFEEKMSALAEKLITARKFYKAEALYKRIRDIADKIRENEAAAKEDSEEVNNLISTMDSLQLTPPGCTLDQGVPHHTRVIVWNMLEEEEQQVKASLQRLQAEQQEICTLLQESTSTSTSTTTTPNHSHSAIDGGAPPSQ